MRLIDADAFEQELKEKLLPLLVEKYGKEEAMKGLHFSLQDCISNIQSQPTITQLDHEWIPCSERLPKETVLVTVKTKTSRYRYVCEAVWIPRWTWKASFDNWEDCSEYNEDEDEFYVNEGWYERVHNWDEYSYIGIEDDVLAWMPLPEPYKEGEQDD